MAYVCDFGTGQTIYLENQGEQTTVTSFVSAPGQQQQSSSSFSTGAWTGKPQVLRTSQGMVIKLATPRGEVLIQVQGQNFQITQQAPGLQQAEQMQVSQTEAMSGIGTETPMQPMQPIEMTPMKPMRMGNMKMGLNPMQMQMGDMAMQMGTSTSNPTSPSSPDATRRFCTQCGQAVAPNDRFCGSCGHALSQ